MCVFVCVCVCVTLRGVFVSVSVDMCKSDVCVVVIEQPWVSVFTSLLVGVSVMSLYCIGQASSLWSFLGSLLSACPVLP